MKTELIFLIVLLINIFIYLNFSKIKFLNKIIDYPDNFRKRHKNPVPLSGGIIIYLSILIIILLSTDKYFNSINLINNLNNLAVFIIILTSIFLIGLIDDFKEINPNLKLLLLFSSISTLLFFDNSLLIQTLKFSFFKDLNLGNFSFFFTILCFLLFMNALNMFDGINLQTSSFLIILLIFLIFKNVFTSFIILVLIPIINYSILNYKNKIFLGDNGTYLLSFLISYVFIKSYNNGLIIFSDEIFICMMIPGIDMFRLFIERIYNKKNPFRPDRNHLHHILIDKFGYKKTIIFLILIILTSIIFLIINLNSLIIILINLVIYTFLILKFKN